MELIFISLTGNSDNFKMYNKSVASRCTVQQERGSHSTLRHVPEP